MFNQSGVMRATAARYLQLSKDTKTGESATSCSTMRWPTRNSQSN